MEDSRKKLYDTLSKSYNLGTFEEFNDKMGYEESRKKLYDTVSEKYNLGDFDTFNQKMGTTYQADKEALEQQMDEWGASNGSFMKEYEDAEKLYRSQSVLGGSGAIDTPQSIFVYDNAQEYGKKRSEIEEMRRRYYSNPLVIKQREGDAGFARQMAEGFATEAKRVEQENPELARKAKAANAAALNPRGAMTGYITDDVKQYNEDRQNYETARRMAESAQDIYAAPSKYDESIGVVNFLKGGRDVANKADFWTMGMVGIADNLNARDALMKVQEKLGSVDDLTAENIDSILTPSEKAIVTAFATNVMAQASRANDLSRGYQAGQGAMESLGFMAQFLLTQGLGSAAAKGASKGIAKAVSKGATDSMTKWLAGQLGKISSSTVKSATKSAAKGVVGTIESVVKASVMTPMIPQTWKTVSDEMLEINDAGKLQEASTAFWHGLGDAMIETWSENAGGMVEKILGVPLSAGKSVWNKALGKTDFGKWGANLTRTPAYNLMKQAGWNGFIAEMGEEFVGNTVRTVTGLDPEALQDFTTVDNLLVTAASFAPMTIIGLGTSAAQYGAAKKRATKAAEHLAQVMKGAGYTPEQIAFTLDDMNASTPVQLSQSLTPVVNQIAKDSGQGSYVFKAAMEYADAMARYRTLDGFYNREQAAQIEDARENIMANTGQQFWQTKEVADGVTTDNVRVITTKEGIRMFVTGESEDGMLAVVKENGEKRFITPDQLANTAGPIPEGEVIVSDESMSLNDFLRSEVVSKKKDAEQQRMSEEANAAIETIRQAARPGTQINLGTAEVPVIGNVVQQIPDGVVVQSEAGVSQLTWEEAGNAMNIAVKPMTDAEIEQQEIDAIEAERAAKEFERAKTEQEAVQAGATEIVSTEEAEDALPLPLKADGSVDQTALWNQSPERWARWNDDQRQDDGINSANYISSALARAQKDLDQTIKAYGNESDFDARASLESDIAAKQKRVNRLAALQQSYIPQETMQEAQAEQTSVPTKPLSSQQLKEKQKPVERTLESEVAHLYELGLNNEEVAANLDAKIAKAQKDLEAQSKKAPLMEADAEAYIEKKRKYEEKMSALQQEADFWSKAKEAVHNLRAQETQMPEAPSEVALESDPEPQNGVELAARELGLREGGIKLLWDSFEHHTGYGSSERSKFFDLFRTKAKGGMTIEQAGERLMELDRENNTGFFDQNDPNAGTNAILDALSDNETIGQLRSYVARQRKAEAEREANAAYSSMNAYYEQTFGEKLEDTALYDEIRSAEILASGLSESEQQELNNIIFAEEISQYGTEGYQTEASGVYESEVAGNATNVEPGAEGIRTESVGVLQGAQSDNSGRDAEPEEGQRGSEGESSEQNALPSVPSGESATAVESSLDEDMPDFSNQIEQVREEVDTDPSEAQKKAGNYKMGHLHLDGYNITIENPKGSVRRGTDSKGNEWENTLNNDYGYIRGTEGVDGDHIDVYLSDNPTEGNVYVIDQVNPETREFDEHKVMYGFNSIDEAREAYLANFSEGWNGLGTITEVTKDEFRKWIDSSHRKTKPFSEYKSVKPESAQSSKAQLSDEEVTRKAVEFFTPGSKALALRERIDSWVSKLGVKVNVMESIDDVKNAQAKALIKKGGKVWGWFESATGEVYIYLPDFASLDLEAGLSEIDKTYIHEIVSHQGLRGLLGEEKYSELCDVVWNALDEDQKNRYLNYPGVNGNTRAAADEFIAHFAENVDYYGNRTLWDKIVDFIKDLLRFNNKIEISNAKLANLLRQSYARLAKNADATNVNQQAEGNTVFRAADGALVGMHNISEEKLRKVIKQGGSANPSTAVIDIGMQSFNSYGEISFIMPSFLVDAGTGRNAGTFTADAWTPTYPHVTKRFSDDKLQRAYWRDVSAIPEEMSHEVRMAFDSWLDDRDARGLAYMFLHERGEAPEMVRVAAKFPQEIKDKLSAILGENRSGLYELSDEEKQAVLDLYIQENFGGNREEFDKSIADRIQRIEDRLSTGKVPSFVEKQITFDLQWMKEHAYDYNELSKFVSAITADIRHAGEVNDAATTNRALDYIKDNGLEKEFDKWKESLNDRYGIKEYLFDGYTPSGNQRWLPNTVENASRLMNKQGLAGATGMAVSFNRFVATLAPKKKTLSDIRASKGRLVEDEKLVDDFREKWSEVFFDLGVKCQPGAKGYEDYGLERLTEAAQQKNPGAYLKKEYGVELSQDDLQKLDEMIKAIKTEFPARYFETKFQRPVYLNEFVAAVMPTTASEEIKQAVSDAGLPIFEYDSAVEGSRKEATLKATEGEGIRFRAEEPRTAPSKDEVPEIIDDLFEQADSSKNKVQRKIISSVTPRQLEEYRKKGILNVTADFVHSIENTALRHENKRHSGDNRTQQPLTKEEWHNILDVIENFDTVEKQKSRSGLDVIVYKKKNNDGTIYYVEEIRTGRKSLALTTAYKKRGDSSELMADALPQTSETTLDNTSFDSKDSDYLDNNNSYEVDTLFRAVTDKKLLDRLNSEPTIKVYRAMQLIDGKLYPPMSAKVDGKMREPIKLGKWEQAEERPDLADEKGYFKLDKGNKTSLKARYNPYFHTSPTPLNDQFSSAQTRPELVTVEVEVPESELTSGYKAEKAKDSVGQMEWKAGVVQAKLSGTRTVILSRWDKPVRIVPDSEVADVIVDMFDGKDIVMPSNVVTPSLRAELEKRGVSFMETDNKGKPVKDTRFRATTGTPTEDIVENGLQLSVQNYARLASDIFAALPENMRREVVEDTFRNGIDMQRAIMQIPTRLAEKDDLSEVEVEVAKMIAGKVQDALLADGVLMTRPLTTAEAIWMLYKHNNAGNDILSAARRSVVADNLGFSNGIIGGRFSNEDDIRFRASRAARADSAARMYNTEARLAWRRLQESWQDMNVSVDSLMRALETASGKAIQAFENIAMALNRLSSKNLADKKKFLRDKLMPLWEKVLEISDKFKVSIEDIERYMMLKHGLERNLVLAARDARNHYKEELEKELSRIDKDSSLSKSEKKAAKAKAEATYQRHLKNIENGTDSEYLENRKKDYGGLTSLYSDYADYGTREDYDTEEEYQEAAKAARTPKYKTLEEAENAAVAEVGSFEAKIGGLTMELWHKVNAATKDTLKHQYNHGMLTKEQYESVRDMFEYYVPLRGFKDNTVEDMYSYYGSGQHNDFAKPLQAAKGRKTEAESPLGWIGSMAESAIQMDNKNDAKLRLYYLAVNRPDNDLMKITETWYEWTGDYNAEGKKIFEPVYPTFSGHLSGDSMQAKMDAFDSMMEQQAMQGNAFRGKQRIDIKGSIIRMPKTEPEHVVNVKVAGKDYSILINGNPRAAQAINGLLNIDNADANGVYRGFRSVLRMMSALSTSYNPEFWISNFQRDMMYAFIGTSIRHDKAYTAEFAKNYIEAFKVISMLRKNKKGALGTSETESYYKEFSENGGVTGYTVLVNNAEYDKMLREFQKDQQKSDFIKKVKSGFEAVADFGEAIEQVSRFAAYMTSRKMGKGIEESVNEAKEITVNFNRKGSGKAISWEEAGQLRNRNGKPLNWAEKVFFVTASGLSPIGRSVYMFFNASIQGLSSAAKLARNNPKKSAVWAGIFLSMGMLNAVLHAMLDDDDDYLDMPEYEKRTNLLIGGNGVYFKWALPQEVRPFYAMADIFVNHAMGRAPHKNITEELASVFADLLPVNTVGAEGLEGVTGALMPSYVSPIYQVIINKDFKGAPIYREMPWIPDDQQKDVPAYTKAYSGTGSLYVNVSEMLNNLSGGDYSKAGAININPAVVEHIVEGYGGGTLTTANKVLKSLGMIAGTEDISFRSMPFLSRILTVNDDRYRNAHTTELYNYYKGISDQAKRSYNAYEKQRDGDKLSELMRSEDWKVHQIFLRYKKMLDYYDKQLKLASTEDERRTIMREQDAQRKRVIEEISRLR